MKGRGIGDWLKKAWGFIKKHNVISRGAAALAPMLGPAAGGILGTVGKVASAAGAGRRRHRMGGALRLAGGYRRRRLHMY
jgi:hypothetical protein